MICAAALMLHWSPFASRREYEGLLRFMLPAEPTDGGTDVKDVLRQCCSLLHLIAMREAAQGDRIEYSYQVRLIDPSYQSDLSSGSADRGSPDANLIMQRTTVEL